MPHAPGATGPAGAPSPRLLVIDADERTRESMVGILAVSDRYDVVGSAGWPADALTIADRTHPDVVIVDPRLPDMRDGIALISRLRASHPQARILAVGWLPETEPEVLAAGADCFVRKTFRPGDLSGAINRCLAPGQGAADPEAEGTPDAT